MRIIATLGNESNVVVIGTYCNSSSLIATNVVVAIDPNPCSASDHPDASYFYGHASHALACNPFHFLCFTN
jgi:hypothetical protein